MITISVTQYVPPHGERRTGYIEVPDAPERQRKYNELTEAGCNITGEVLTPGAVLDRYMVSTCISCEEVDDDFVTHVTPHPTDGGPSGAEAAGQAIDKWNSDKFHEWKVGVLARQ